MTVMLLTEHHSEFLSSKEGCTGSSEFICVKIPNCLKSHDEAQLLMSDKRKMIHARIQKKNCQRGSISDNVFFCFVFQIIREGGSVYH